MTQAPNIHVQTCPCGLQIKFKDKHIGATIACTNCGLDITLRLPYAKSQNIQRDIVDPEPFTRDDDSSFALEDPDVDLPGAPPAREVAAFAPPITEKQQRKNAREASDIRTTRDRADRRSAGFWGDALRSLAFLHSIDVFVKLFVLVVLMTISDIAAPIPILGALCWLIASGVAFAFYFNTIIYSAGGDNGLPDFEWESWWESAIKPVLTMLFITMLIASPGIALQFLVPDQPVAVFGALAATAFLWPVIMLMVALGGGGMMVRIDLAVRTIVSAPVPYIAIWFLLAVAVVFQMLAMGAGFGQLPAEMVELLEEPIIGNTIVNLSAVYFSLSVMKIIGLYYRHFSDRFPWDAG